MHLKFYTDKAELLILHAKTCFFHGPPISTKVNPAFQLLGQKLFSILDFSLSLIALIQAMNKTCWLCLQNVSRIWPLLIASTAMVRFTIISCLNLMIRPNFLYSQRSEADIEGTAWRKLNHSDWEYRIIFLLRRKGREEKRLLSDLLGKWKPSSESTWHFLRTDKCSTWPESCCHRCNVYSFPPLQPSFFFFFYTMTL